MLGWVLFFCLIAVVAAYFGFGGVATLSSNIAVLLLVVFLVLMIIAIIVRGIVRASRGRMP